MPLGNNKETLSPSKETEKIHLQNHKDLKEQGIIIPDGLKKDFDIKTTQEDIQNLKEELNTAGANQAEILKKFLWLEKEQTKVVAQETLKKFKKEEVASEEKEVNEEEKLEKEIETALENGDTNEEEAEKNSIRVSFNDRNQVVSIQGKKIDELKFLVFLGYAYGQSDNGRWWNT